MNDLDYIIFENDIAVCESLENCLEKAELMLENSGYSESLDDFVSEMFDVYMEATQRRKKADEIDAYMKKHNWGDTKSKTPANAKRARQVRNFLMMHDFDPKTSTIKSDYVDDKGKSGRIKFNMNVKKPDVGYSSSDNKITIDGLRQKPVRNSILLSHEKGHDMFRRDGRNAYWSKQENKSERGIKFIDKAKSRGREINTHDDGSYKVPLHHQSPEELEADLHSAKTARVRTKYAGSKRAVKRSGATRNVTRNEITTYFKKFQNKWGRVSLRFVGNVDMWGQRRKVDDVGHLVSMVSYQIRNFHDKWNTQTLDLDLHSDVGMEKALSVFTENRRKFEYDIKSFYNTTGSTKQKTRGTYESIIDDYGSLKKCFDIFTKDINDIKAKLSKSDLDDAEKNELVSLLEYVEQNFNEIKPQIDAIESKYPTISKSVNYFNWEIGSICKELNDCMQVREPSKKTAVRFFTAVDKLTPDFLDKCESSFRAWYELEEKVLKKARKAYDKFINDVNHWFDDSTKMRHDFVQHYVHEYFTEFMSNYYSFENVFYDDETG